MSAGERVAALSNRFYLRIRHPEAFTAAAEAGTAQGFDALSGHKYCLLTTFKRSGESIPTPVWFGLGEEDGRVYIRSEAHVGKIKRIRNDPHVRLAPSTLRGKPVGPTAEGRARILPAAEEERAEAAVQANYGLFRRVYEGAGKATAVEAVYIEVTPA